MKTYYFTLATDIPKNGGWSDAKQRQTECKNWDEFVNYCYKVAYSFNSIVRGCESEGYNNQGHYFNNQ